MRILIVEDDIYQRAGVSEALLSRGAEVQSAADFTTALHWVVEWQPDVVVLDLLIPLKTGLPRTEQEAHGLYLAKEIKRLYPHMGLVFHSAHVIFSIIKQYGGVAFVYKGEQPPAVLWEAIQQAQQGKVILDEYLQGKPPPLQLSMLTPEEQEVAILALSRMGNLSDKQLEIVAKIAASRTPIGIAKDLNLQKDTIHRYLSQIYDDLGLGANTNQEIIIDRRAIITKVYPIYLAGKNYDAA
jgi:DNA-binding NarL/FixJ family response regulator